MGAIKIRHEVICHAGSGSNGGTSGRKDHLGKDTRDYVKPSYCSANLPGRWPAGLAPEPNATFVILQNLHGIDRQ